MAGKDAVRDLLAQQAAVHREALVGAGARLASELEPRRALALAVRAWPLPSLGASSALGYCLVPRKKRGRTDELCDPQAFEQNGGASEDPVLAEPSRAARICGAARRIATAQLLRVARGILLD